MLRDLRPVLLLALCPFSAPGSSGFESHRSFVKQYCLACHRGKSAVGGFDAERYNTVQSIVSDARRWSRAAARVREWEMPPKGAPAPAIEQREAFVVWVEQTLRSAACAEGVSPGAAPLRRLNRNEYSATVRDLLEIHINAGHALPPDGAGGEGFDNAAETLFLSPMHAEKYLEAAKQALEYAARDPKARARFLIAEPAGDLTPEQAARTILERFLPRAFRRPATPAEVDRYLDLFRKSLGRGDPFDDAILFALRAVLISPNFLFRIAEPNPAPEPRPVSDYELASRLSYFLWASMPDDQLFDLASRSVLHDPETLKQQIARMLKDIKAREFADSFVEQWLGTRELGRDIKPDAKLFPEYYDAELQAAFRYEPILFFQEILSQDLSLLNLIDSRFTILNNKLQKHYGITLKDKLRQQPVWVELPEGTHRGGLLGMAAVLAVSSYPHRTSPVLRGKWILDTLLGTPPPPPPPDVPELEDGQAPTAAKTLRERLTGHRRNPTCAGCHSRIDPLGFSLENYGVLGVWRSEDGSQPIDSKGELPDGTAFEGPDGLKSVLLARKDVFLRNLTSKLLGYALGRGLTFEDSCTVERIVEQLKRNDYRSHTLIREIVTSVPFRYQPGTEPGRAVEESVE